MRCEQLAPRLLSELVARFGAVLRRSDDVVGYGSDVLVFDLKNPREGQVREPQRYLSDIATPTFVFEGSGGRSNYSSLVALKKRCRNPLVQFHAIRGGSHFTIIAPLVEEISRNINADSNPPGDFKYTHTFTSQ